MGQAIVILAVASGLLVQKWESGPVSVMLNPYPGEITVAGVYALKVTAIVPAASLEETLRTGQDRRYAMESLTDQLSHIDGLRLTSDAGREEERRNGLVRTSWIFLFEPRRAGVVEIPALELVFTSPSAPRVVIQTEPVPVTIRSLVEGSPLEAAPRPAMALPAAPGNGAWPLLVALGAGLGATWWSWRERREMPLMPLVGGASLSPREAALASLRSTAEPGRWLAILHDYLAAAGAVPAESLARGSDDLRHLLRDLDVLRFGRDGSLKAGAVRRRLETFIETVEL